MNRTHTKPVATVVNRVSRVLIKRKQEKSFGEDETTPVLGKNDTLRFLRPCTKAALSSSSESSRSPEVDCAIPWRLTLRVVISNSLLRPHAGCWANDRMSIRVTDNGPRYDKPLKANALTTHMGNHAKRSGQWDRMLCDESIGTDHEVYQTPRTVYEAIPRRHWSPPSRLHCTTNDYQFLCS